MKRTSEIIYKTTLNWLSNLCLWVIYTALLLVICTFSKGLCVAAIVVTFIIVMYNNCKE